GSPLSQGIAGMVQGGDRLPWINVNVNADNYAPLASLDWQVHVYGEASSDLHAACASRGLPLHVFPWREEMARVGLQCDALYFIRPDGYIALTTCYDRANAITSYLKAHGISPNQRSASQP